MTRTTFAAIRRIFVSVLGAISIVAIVAAMMLFDSVVYAESVRYDVISTHSAIVPGVDETKYITNDRENSDQVVAYAIEVDLNQSTIIAGYKDYDAGTWGMQTVREQAAAAEKMRGVKVVAAVNGDFYNMGTGEPTGSLVMNGEVIKENKATNYFAVLNDGTAVIRTGALHGDEKEAIGGSTLIIVDGEIPEMSGDYNTTKQPRTAVGIKEDGTVVFVVADGRQAPYSSGYTLLELANKMLELGCVSAMNLDGGGSTTYLAKYAGEDELTLANSPADGEERSVSTSLLIVSASEATGEFDSVVIHPDNEVYTPGSTVELTAIGVDTAGFGMAVPDGVTWRLADSYSQMGVIVENPSETEGQIAALFTAAESKTGTAVVEAVYNGAVVGSVTIELQWPDTLTMANSQFSLDFSEETDFGLEAYWKTRVVHLKAGDIEWNIGSTGKFKEEPVMVPQVDSNGKPVVDSEGNPILEPQLDDEGNIVYQPVKDEQGNPVPIVIGVMNGNTFVADPEATNVTATVTATLKQQSSVSISAEVSVGQLPYVLWDFEDIKNEDGSVTLAEDYYTFGDGGRFKLSTANKGEIVSAKIVDSSTGEVRVGQKALQLNYDFTQAQKNATLGIYFGTAEKFNMPSDFGMPTAFGVWIYVPTEGFNFWLRTWFTGHTADGTQIPGNSFSQGFGGNYTEVGEELDVGWNYIYVDFTVQNGYGASYYQFGNQMFRIMLTCSNGVPNAGSYTSGYIYLDNFQFEYGPNTDDLFAPIINAVNLNGESGVALEDGMTISDDPISIFASYQDFNGLSDEELAEIEDEEERERYEKASLYATGINSENVHVYVDGNEVKLNNATATYLSTSTISLTNGSHNITVEVYDNFQNVTIKSYTVYVENDMEYSSVYLQPQESSPYLGSTYELDLIADRADLIETVTFEIKLGTGLSLAECTDIATGFEITEIEIVHVNNNIFRVTLQRNEEEIIRLQHPMSLAKINIDCPATLVEGSILLYSIESSKVTYVDGFQSEIMNSFFDENRGEDIISYYTISSDIMIVGSEGGYIYVADPDGNPAADVNITIDGEFEGITDKEGKLFTSSFVSQACTKTVAAYSEEGYSFGMRISGVLPGGAVDETGASLPTPIFVRAVATTNGNNEQRIVWLVNPLAVGESDKAYVKYAVAEKYAKEGDSAFTTVEGDSVLMEFSDGYAVRINTKLLEDLSPDTSYVYMVGDGSNWSELKEFSTTKVNGETNFFIIGDTQEDNPEAIKAYGDSILGSGINYDFAIQTGDFVDNGSRYELWNGILSLFAEYFSEIDIVQVFGNHEYEGSAGEYPLAMNYVPGKDYYSVTYGNVYVAVINIYTDTGLAEAMNWIKADAAKSDAVWKVLTMHRPPYYTNISGGSETAHEMIPAFVDEVGFDVVFSGHDHSYARTKPMTGGQVDEKNGAVYYIVGAAEAGRYGVYNNPEFNFEVASRDFNAIYISVSASYTQMVITAYNLLSDGSFEVFDTYTIKNECYPDNHVFVYDTISEMLVCQHCHYSVSPEEISFSGLITDTEGRNMFFTFGKKQTGWIAIGEDYYYFDEDGRGVNGNVVVQSSYDGNDSGSITFLFENGKKIGGHTGWYGEKYYIDGEFQTGFIELDGKIYYLWTSEDNRWTGYELGQRARGYRQIAFHTEWGWTWDTFFWFDETDGHLLGEAYDEDGNMMPGKFYNRVVNGKNLYSYIIIEGTGQNITSDLYRNGWIVANEYAGEAEGSVYYLLWDNMILGDYEIDGVTYKFNDAGTDPLTQGTGALLGRYYTIRFVSDGETLSQSLVFEGEEITAPESPSKQGNSIKTYTFVGWFNGENKLETTSVATADATYTAKFDTVYTETYNNVIKLLAALTEADTPVEKHAAVNAMDAAYKALSQAQISDMKAEGVSFALYEEMLSKIYTVTFVVEGKTINTVILYEGEEITAPESPSKQGNSIKTYNFVGWFNGENKLETTSVATADATYTAEFAIQYIENYIELRNALDTLANISNGTLEQKYEALTSVYYSLESISEIQKAEAEAEGLSFELYETMLAEYNGIAADAAEDIEKAVNIADGLMDGLASLFLFAAAAYVASKEVIL